MVRAFYIPEREAQEILVEGLAGASMRV